MDRAATTALACAQASLVPRSTSRLVRPPYFAASGLKFQFISVLKTSGNSWWFR